MRCNHVAKPIHYCLYSNTLDIIRPTVPFLSPAPAYGNSCGVRFHYVMLARSLSWRDNSGQIRRFFFFLKRLTVVVTIHYLSTSYHYICVLLQIKSSRIKTDNNTLQNYHRLVTTASGYVTTRACSLP